MIILNLIGIVVSIILGFYILFAGRYAIWATLGSVSLSAMATLLAVLVAGLNSGRDLIAADEWGLLGIAFGISVLSIFVGLYKQELAVLLLGFIAGADVALWFYDISTYVVTSIANQTHEVAVGVGIVVLVVGGLLGLLWVKRARDEALIVITVLVGTHILQDAFRLDKTSSWTAIIMISLALAGVLVQYTFYLRELKAQETEPKPQISSLAYFQDLELDI